MLKIVNRKLSLASLLLSILLFACSKSEADVHIEGTYLGRISINDTTYNNYYVHIDKLSTDRVRVYYASLPMFPYFELSLKTVGGTIQSDDKSIALKYSGVTRLVEFNRDSVIIFAGVKVE